MTEIDTLHDRDLFEDAIAPDAGIFAWTILDNTLFGDPAVAELFGLEATETLAGLPLEAYLDRVHPLDRPSLAKVISDTILGQMPQQNVYRVRDCNGEYKLVVAYGRAFRDRTGAPVVYSGIIVPASEGEQQCRPHLCH